MEVNLSSSLHNVLDTVVNWLPTLLIVVVILIVGWILAAILRAGTRKLLDLANLNGHLVRTQFGERINDTLGGASNFAGRIVYLIVWLGTFSVAASQLHLSPVNNFVDSVYGYLPNVVAALAIFVGAVVVSSFVKSVAERLLGETPTGRIVGAVVPVIVMSIAGFMVLNQLRLAPEIVNITYAALVGALALGLALSFGLGGRDVAARMLEQAYKSGQKSVDQVKKDVKVKKASKQTTKK